MNNTPETLERIANEAIDGYMRDRKEPTGTLTDLLRKEAQVTFEHCRRVCEKVNVGLATKMAMPNREDRGMTFPLADAPMVAQNLGIYTSNEEFSKMAGKKKGTMKKVAAAAVAPIERGKFRLGAERPENSTFEQLRKIATAGGLTPEPVAAEAPVIHKVAGAPAPSDREIIGMRFEYVRSMAKLAERVRKHVIEESRDVNKVALAVIDALGRPAARTFLQSCKEAGVQGFNASTSPLIPPGCLPTPLRAAVSEAHAAYAKIASHLAVAGCAVCNKAPEALDVQEIAMAKEGALAGVAVGRTSQGYFVFQQGYRSAAVKLAEITPEFLARFRAAIGEAK